MLRATRSLIIGFYIYRFLRYSYFHVAIGLMYFQSCGLSLSQALSLESIYYVSKAACDVPGGYIADRLGRKASLIAGSLTCAAAYSIIGLSATYPMFAFAEALLGLAMSLATSSDSALVYDELQARGASESYERVEGTGWAMRNLGFAAASAAGSWIAARSSLGIPFLLSAGVIATSTIFIALFLHEPHFARNDRTVSWWRSIGEVLGRRSAVPIILYFAIVFVGVRIGFWAFQPILNALSVDIRWFGMLFGFVLAISLAAALRISWVHQVTGGLWTVLTVLGTLCCIVIGIGVGVRGSAGLIIVMMGFSIHAVVQGLYDPLMRKEINDLTYGSVRASTMAITTMLGNLGFAATAPLYGSALKEFGYGTTMIIIGAVFGLVSGALAWRIISIERIRVGNIMKKI